MDVLRKIELGLLVCIFLLGIAFYISLVNSGTISGFLIFGNEKVNSPYDFVNEDNIEAYNDKIVIKIENPILTKYGDSGSMLPFINEGTTGIGIKPKLEEDIHVGDIITFEKEGVPIVHRVIEKGKDEHGIYFITKGDNNNNLDDGKIRFEDIDFVLVGIVY